MKENVECKDCGLLAIIHPESGERCEANQDVRSTGKFRFISKNFRPAEYVPQLICHAGKRPLHKETFREKQDLVHAISEQISCDGFVSYEPGRSPKELEEMSIQQSVMNLQEKLVSLHESMFAWKQEQAEKDQRWESQLQALQELRHQESLNIGKSQASGSYLQAHAGFAGFAVALLTLAYMIIEKLVLWLWK